MTSVLPAEPVIVTPLTRSADRVSVPLPEVMEICPPDDVTVTGPLAALAAHASWKVIAAPSLVSVPPVASIEAVTSVAPALAFVTSTEHFPSAPVVHVAPFGNVAPPVPANVTLAPSVGAPLSVTVAVTVTVEPAAAC